MKQILIVDDHPQNLYLLQALLQGHGYRVTEACNGEEALRKAHQEVPALIVADILMPVMDGFELCRRWKSDPELRQIPFIFYTATYTDAKDEAFALGLGADRFIVKPQEPDTFIAIVRAVLQQFNEEGMTPNTPTLRDETTLVREYNEVLIRKLEDKMAQLEETNHRLQIDIEERRRTEERLKRLATAIEQSGEAVVITDPCGIMQYVNPAFEAITGYPPEEAVGQSISILRSGKQPPSLYQHLWGTISRGETWKGRLINRRKDGSLYSEDSTISPVHDEDGTIVSFVAVKRDISETLKLEEQIRQAVKMEAVGRLAAGVAHDINNALTPLMVTSTFILNETRSENGLHDDIRIIQESGERCVNLARQLLAFSRNQPMNMVALNMNRVVSDLTRLLPRMIGEHIELKTHLEEPLAPILGDTGLMEQIIVNLVVNARDAMPRGGILTLETRNCTLTEEGARAIPNTPPGSYVLLIVSDNGSGMDQKTREQVFEPFFTTKARGEGTGLGLSTVYGIVRQCKGSISIHSEPNQGTSVHILLPTIENQQEKNTTPVLMVTSEHLQGGETILLVEDDPGVRKAALRILRVQGYTLLAAESGEKALELCQTHEGPIHLLITDVIMPGMNGHELNRKVLGLRPDIKTLFMSGYPDRILRQENALGTGMFLQKPFSFESLGEKVRQCLKEQP